MSCYSRGYCVESKAWTPRHKSGFRNDRHRTGQKEQDSGHRLENSSLCLGELLTELGTGFLKPTLSSWQKMCSRSRSHLCKQSRSQNFLPLTYHGGNLICWGGGLAVLTRWSSGLRHGSALLFLPSSQYCISGLSRLRQNEQRKSPLSEKKREMNQTLF